ncbi:hypothetical protein PsorP6_014825 [Peronosclerospora sorghi]|uniref:Uncharacterized protein n=1 Tax=Peronosclerospora sorghi TaxID=230839 RepID=A0ACC0VUI8_9STRA|nr:hypothetical protein PsorP6_014825 [Peronosclerospora sorghi]
MSVANPASSNRNWRAVALVTVATCTLTTASILLLRSWRHFPSFWWYKRKRRPQDFVPIVHSKDLLDRNEDMTEGDKRFLPWKMQGRGMIYLNNADACLDFTVGANVDEELDDAKFVIKQICSDWRNAENDDISIKIIVGGITNRLYRLTWRNKVHINENVPSVLVRLYGDHTEEFIDRSIENMLFAKLSKRGFAPTYYGRFTNGRIEGWLDARPLEPEEMSQTKPINYLQMIGKELGLMHVMDILEDRAPVLWTKLERFEKLAMEIQQKDSTSKNALYKLDLKGLHEKLIWLKSVLPSDLNGNGKELLDGRDVDEISKQAEKFASDIVFSHNDLLSGNILYNPGWDRVRIIDYEYGGYNYRAFDIANHFCENCGFDLDLEMYPSIEKQVAFFKAYMSTAAPNLLAQLESNRESKAFFHALYDVVNRYALASHLFWGYWAVVQAAHSTIDFDFLQYAAKRFSAFDVQRDFFIG